jgi:hypothetical protein
MNECCFNSRPGRKVADRSGRGASGSRAPDLEVAIDIEAAGFRMIRLMVWIEWKSVIFNERSDGLKSGRTDALSLIG